MAENGQEEGLEARRLLDEIEGTSKVVQQRPVAFDIGSPQAAEAATVLPSDAARSGAVRHALYASHFLSTWGQRGWEFAVGLIMLEIHPSSLLLVSVFGLLDAAVQVVFGAPIGAYVDRTDRLRAAQQMYMLQNGMVALSASTALALLWTGARAGGLYWACLLVTLCAGAASSLGALGATLSVEREWTKVLCSGQSATLARMNAVMKRIDLTCLIASPISVGLVMTYGGSRPMVAATLMLLLWNLLAWAPECLLLAYAQHRSPALAAPKQQPPPEAPAPADSKEEVGDGPGEGGGRRGRLRGAGGRMLAGWSLYFRQPLAPAALALALLYLTVLSFGTLMTAYLKWVGMAEAELSLYRGLGAVAGLAATLAFPPLHRTVGLLPTGAAAVWAQLACLLVATLPSLAAALGAAVPAAAVRYCLVGGLVLSRLGLWGFDLATNQLLQERVPDGQLGAVTGVQSSLQSAFQMAAYGAGVVVWQPERFPWLMAGSCACVATAAAMFTAFAVRERRRSVQEVLDVRIPRLAVVDL